MICAQKKFINRYRRSSGAKMSVLTDRCVRAGRKTLYRLAGQWMLRPRLSFSGRGGALALDSARVSVLDFRRQGNPEKYLAAGMCGGVLCQPLAQICRVESLKRKTCCNQSNF